MKYLPIPKPAKFSHIQPHPDADNLGIIKYHGDLYVVGKNVALGDRVVFFPAGTILHPDFLYANNLYGDSERNFDTSISGFFPNNGRVKLTKVRGVTSCGFVATKEQFSKMGELIAYNKRVRFYCGSEKYFLRRYYSPEQKRWFKMKKLYKNAGQTGE